MSERSSLVENVDMEEMIQCVSAHDFCTKVSTVYFTMLMFSCVVGLMIK